MYISINLDLIHPYTTYLLRSNKLSELLPAVSEGMVDVPPDPELDQVHSQLLKVDEVLQHEMAKEVWDIEPQLISHLGPK